MQVECLYCRKILKPRTAAHTHRIKERQKNGIPADAHSWQNNTRPYQMAISTAKTQKLMSQYQNAQEYTYTPKIKPRKKEKRQHNEEKENGKIETNINPGNTSTELKVIHLVDTASMSISGLIQQTQIIYTKTG